MTLIDSPDDKPISQALLDRGGLKGEVRFSSVTSK